MSFEDGEIEGIIVQDMEVFSDQRGWLTELFREDQLPAGFRPVMAYLSVTRPGVVRGPHEHNEQTDYFCFIGSFILYLWDNREDSPTYLRRMVIREVEKRVIIVPPGVVHAYKNTGDADGLVLNFPDRLYGGWGKKEKVDEIRYEDVRENPFRVE